MTANPLVSVIITTYNRVKLLEETLVSVRNQTYPNIEIIIVSDASNDGTDLFIQSISDSRLKYLKLEHNSGLPAVSRNHGLKHAYGEYIAFCDDDDLWIETKIEKQLKKIENHDMCFTKRAFINENGDKISHRPLYIPNRLNLRGLLITNYITLSSVLIEKKLLDTFNGFNVSPLFKASEDYELWTRLLANNVKIIICPENLVLYRIHSNNISNNQLAGVERTLLINKQLFEKENVAISNILFSWIVNYLKKLCYLMLSFIR
jgi:teichuronic acid biosynthesis glycosyltransferase TuaG